MALNADDKEVAAAIARGLGEELRSRREALGLSQAKLVQRLPSGIGDRTLLAYEHGIRTLSVVRLAELAEAREAGAPAIVANGLQRARLVLEHMPLRVDLRRLLENASANVRPLHTWARNRMCDSGQDVVEVSPSGVRELAAAVGVPVAAVTQHLASFYPEVG